MIERETIGGVPLGLSRDFAHLPPTGSPPSPRRCPHCLLTYEDVERRMEDGCRVKAVMCETCREEGRLRWIAAKAAELVVVPRAVATYRKIAR